MRLSGFGKLCVISGLALVVMIGLAGSTTQASTGLLQATSTTTGTGTTNNMSMTAASTAMMSGTMAATMSSMTGAACPASVSGVTVATASATTGSAVMSATMDATSSAGASGPGYIGIRVAAIDDCGVRVAGVIAQPGSDWRIASGRCDHRSERHSAFDGFRWQHRHYDVWLGNDGSDKQPGVGSHSSIYWEHDCDEQREHNGVFQLLSDNLHKRSDSFADGSACWTAA